jgi:ABC-type multidrug transport system ATPase subunit
VIVVEDLVVRFGEVRALDGVSLTVRDGEILCLLGSNGSGKTTLLRTVAGLQRPTSGCVRVGDRDVWRSRTSVWAQIDFLEAQQNLPDSHTAIESIMLFCPELTREQAERKAAATLGPDGLDLPAGHLLKPVSVLSHGMRQKVLVATLRDVPIWLLDEPTQGFDPGISTRFREYVVGQQRTVLWVTHSVADARRADRVVFLRNGRIAALGPPRTLERWLGADTLEEVYSQAASAEGRFRCGTLVPVFDESLPAGTFAGGPAGVREMIVESEVWVRSGAATAGDVLRLSKVPPDGGRQSVAYPPGGSRSVCWLEQEA